MRDTLVEIDGHNKNKMNTAYHFGSIELTNQTLKDSFGLVPDYYMVVNFYGMEDIIDALGGVDIHIERKELEDLNMSIAEINQLDPAHSAAKINKEGTYRLNGRQAVAYMRIRHIGGDAARIGRQQTVLNELFAKIKDIGIGQIPGLIDVLAQYVRTDIPIAKMVEIASAVKNMSGSEINTYRYPEEYENSSYKGMAVVQPKDPDAAIQSLYDFLRE